jgi:maltooligosyltrehalose trehalohydrolase
MPDSDWSLEFGARVLPGGFTRFRVWAPRARTLSVFLPHGAVALLRHSSGVFEATVAGIPAGTDYFYQFDDGRRRPDPVSRFQPHGVHGASCVVDPDEFQWTDREWRGIPLRDYVFYELHTGTFTPEGTFDAAIARLEDLRDLGVTAVEIMPVAEFPGPRNWGYDGVSLYAPQSTYGGPAALKRLVDACHARGLAAVLDVVYNHLGPDGNYLAEFGPYFTDRYRTPWGEAVNYDGPHSDAVRRFFLDNALYWLSEYHFDALRLDAIHGIFDFSARHFLDELRGAFHRQAAALSRQAYLIAESDLNDSRIVRPPHQGGYGIDAQWMDDFHHSLVTVLAGAQPGYLADFGSLAGLAKCLTDGFVFDGCYSPHRLRRFGNSSADLPGDRFVVCVQNHDQVANAFHGMRLSTLLTIEEQKIAAAILICSPYLPLLFMGQEYAETAPFHYFTSHADPGLAEAVREGRRREFAEFAEHFSDPQDPATFGASKLDWTLREREPHSALRAFYRGLLAMRRRHAALHNGRKDLTRVSFDEAARTLTLERSDPSGDRVTLVVDFAARTFALSPDT